MQTPLGHMHYILRLTDPDRGIPSLLERKKKKKNACRLMSDEGKKIKGKFHEFYYIFGNFNIFFTYKVRDRREHLWHVGGKNKIKAE